MAQIGDFQDLLDAISSAKSILEPSKLDIIREEARLERRSQLDVAALNILNEDIKDLRDKKEGLEESGVVSYLDLEKFPLSSDTGQLQNYASRKFDDVNDALDAMSQKRDRLLSEIRGIKEMHAISQEQSQRLLEIKGDYAPGGAFSHVFERSDFEEAQKDYGSQLKSMKNPDGTPMHNERDIAVRLHFHNKAYLQQNAVEASAHIEAAFDLQERKYGVAFVDWQNTASPKTAQGTIPLTSFQNVENVVIDAVARFEENIVNNAQTMYDSGQWTTDNAPIKVNKDGEATYNDKWLQQDYVDIKGKKTELTRLERIKFDMRTGIQDFLGHSNTTEAFKSAINPGSLSNILLTNTSQAILVPGLGYGKLIWGNQFKLMEDFYNQDTIQKHINQRIMKKSSIRNRTMSLIDQNRI